MRIFYELGEFLTHTTKGLINVVYFKQIIMEMFFISERQHLKALVFALHFLQHPLFIR